MLQYMQVKKVNGIHDQLDSSPISLDPSPISLDPGLIDDWPRHLKSSSVNDVVETKQFYS